MPAVLALLGCALSHRVGNSLVAPDYVTPVSSTGQIAAVSYSTGEKRAAPQPYAPAPFQADGRSFERAVEVTSHGWIDVVPLGDDVEVSVWIRDPGLVRRDFTQVRSVTGALDRTHPTEVRFLPDHINAPLHLDLRDLGNTYNDYDFGEGDLLLVEAGRVGDEPERYLFLTHEIGPRIKFGGGVLFTVPLSVLGENQPERTSTVLAFTTSFGYRYSTRSPALRWFGGKSAIVLSLGIGSTALTAPDLSLPLDQQLLGNFNAAIIGGGVELYDFVSVQALVNLTSLGRDMSEAPAVLAIGFDPVQFGLFTRDVGARIFRRNTLD